MFDEVADTLHGSGDVNVAKVDCTSTGDVCSSMNIQGYPTLMYLEDGGDIKIKYTGTRDLVGGSVDATRIRKHTLAHSHIHCPRIPSWSL
jgi:hypothetical protein